MRFCCVAPRASSSAMVVRVYRQTGKCALPTAPDSLPASLIRRSVFSCFLNKCRPSSLPQAPPLYLLASAQKQLYPVSRKSSSNPRHPSHSGEIVDKEGYLCNPRAARELAFSILYAGLVSGQKPMRIFRERLKQRSGHFAKELLLRYKHAPESGDSIFVEDAMTAKNVELHQEEESMLEAAVLSAPPSKVYNKSMLMLAQQIIEATVDSWSAHELILTDLVPESWKELGGSVAAQQCILQLSMAEMAKCGTSPPIAINEAVELAKRYLDQHAARVINGCLGNFSRSEYYKEIVGSKKEKMASK